MDKKYFGFAIGDSMFDIFGADEGDEIIISRKVLNPDQAKIVIDAGVISCCNPSHVATITALKERFGIEVSIPENPPRIALDYGDSIIVMGVRGLPRLTDRHEYTASEVASATFTFSKYTVVNYKIVP